MSFMFLPILFDVHGTYGRLGPGSSFDVETLLGRRALNSALRASTHKNNDDLLTVSYRTMYGAFSFGCRVSFVHVLLDSFLGEGSFVF